VTRIKSNWGGGTGQKEKITVWPSKAVGVGEENAAGGHPADRGRKVTYKTLPGEKGKRKEVEKRLHGKEPTRIYPTCNTKLIRKKELRLAAIWLVE